MELPSIQERFTNTTRTKQTGSVLQEVCSTAGANTAGTPDDSFLVPVLLHVALQVFLVLLYSVSGTQHFLWEKKDFHSGYFMKFQ